jgi:hypothetical protein
MTLSRVRYLVAVSAGLVLAALPSTTLAHGPLRSVIDVHRGTPGTLVQVDLRYGKLEVVLNPDPQELSNPGLLNHPHAALYKPQRPTRRLLLYEGQGPKTSRIPRVPAGRYLILIFDPSEGWPRHHYTWTTFTVTSENPLPETGSQLPASVGAVALVLIACGLLLALADRTRGAEGQ